MDRQNNPKKNEDLTPEELWKRVSQQLSSKKLETASRTAYNTSYDFSSITSGIAKITAERLEEQDKEDFFRTEIENSLLNAPLFKELELKYPIRNKKKTPAFFPKSPFYLFENPGFYKHFDFDTLFFIFYYCKGTVQQTYAAIRLKQESWRFHLKYKMWFQRLDEPKLITSEYEKGEFIFFDYETTWNYMKKNDFVFEYYYLEQGEHF